MRKFSFSSAFQALHSQNDGREDAGRSTPPNDSQFNEAMAKEIALNASRELALFHYVEALENGELSREKSPVIDSVLDATQNDAQLTQMIVEAHQEMAQNQLWFTSQSAAQTARQALQSRLQTSTASTQSESDTTISVHDVLHLWEQESQNEISPVSPSLRARHDAKWHAARELLSGRRDILPARITTAAMQEFWQNLGVSLPREVSARFTQIARFLAMAQQQDASHLAAARRAESSGLARSLAAPAPAVSALETPIQMETDAEIDNAPISPEAPDAKADA